jgi:hypothetical protein
MRNYTILRKPENLDWSTIPAASIDNLLWTPSVDITSQAQLCYDEEAIYVRLSAKEANIRAEENGPLGMPCQDSCLEFFFSPMEEDPRYFNFEFNPVKCMFLGLGSCRYDSVRLLPSAAEELFNPCPVLTENGWEITYTVPYSYIRQFFPEFNPCSGYSTRANFYKCAEKTEPPHFLCWSLVVDRPWSFHNYDRFGTVHFE